MGVERFFSSLRRDYNFIHKINKKIECQHLLIDFNSIVHIMSQFLLSNIKNDKDINTETFEIKLIDEVGYYIETLLKEQFHSNQIITITICVDGVPSMAKINEQRKRRYMGEIISKLIKEDNDKFYWSRNNISPGTQFMANMIVFLKSSNFENRLQKICHNLKDYIVSGIDEMGEGEIKILHYIDNIVAMQQIDPNGHINKNNDYKNDNFVIYSPDSDVIILLLMKSVNSNIVAKQQIDQKGHINSNLNLYMLRYDQQLSTYKNPVYSGVDINHYKKILFEYVSSRMNKKVEMTAVIMDIVFILTVFGDDFLPKLETLRVNTDINLIMDHYILTLIKYGYILNKSNNNYSINIENFFSFLKLIQKKEDYFLRRNARYHVSSNYNRIVNDIVGYHMNELRELIVEYLWKFIYYNKPEFIAVSPLNAYKTIDNNSFIILDSFMNKPEPKKNMSKFANMSFKNELIWNKMLAIISDYYIEILNVIDGKKLKSKNIYSNEIFFIEALPNELLKDIIKYFYLSYELPITIPLKMNLDNQNSKLMMNNYKSTEQPHKSKLSVLNKNDIEYYKLDRKLDNYYKILNPKDQFYYDIYLKNKIDYANYYKIHFNNIDPKGHIDQKGNIISDYLKGFNWIVNYYHNANPNYNNIDLTWYFRHNRSPLLKDIVNHGNTNVLNIKMINTFNKHNHYMTPLEHYLFVSPLNYNNTFNNMYEQLKITIGYLSNDKIKIIIKFIKSHTKYYYELDKINKELKDTSPKDLIDCSSSIFLSKCHLLFMENYISMVNFINDFRKYIN
jgi:5'-3' exonuclease